MLIHWMFRMKQAFATVLLLSLAAVTASAQSNGPLRVHPDNPRYFTDDSGQAILLAGSHTWSNLVDVGPSDPPTVFDFDAHLAWMKGYGHNFIRGWAVEPTTMDTTRMGHGALRIHAVAPHPWVRVGPDRANDGLPKFDLDRFNPDYFERLRTRVAQAQQQGFFISIMLFEGYGVQLLPDGWANHPFNPANNINGIDGDLDGDGRGLEVHQLAVPRVTQLQEAYVRKVVETVNGFDNVLYEIINESPPTSTEWQYHMIRFVKACEKDQPKQHPVGMTFQNRGGKNETLFDSPADWISPNPDGGFQANPPDMNGRKVVLTDTDHLWGIGGNAAWVWKSVTRGLNPIFMDPYDGIVMAPDITGSFEPLRIALGRALAVTRRMNLVRATPQNALASTEYCLAEPGVTYLVFAPKGGDIVVDLTMGTGTFAVEWHHPESGEITTAPAIAGGVRQTFHPPFEGPAVLFLARE